MTKFVSLSFVFTLAPVLVNATTPPSTSTRTRVESWARPFPQPAALSRTDLRDIERALNNDSLLTNDVECRVNAEEITATEIEPSYADREVCAGKDKEIVYLSSTQGLYLCEEGRATKAMKGSIGSNGLSKWVAGDRRTPIGTFWLGKPRTSRFGIFVPIGYPNAEALRAGRGGGDVGLHGPIRGLRATPVCNVRAFSNVNWTAGCVSVARDAQIIEIAAWVVRNWPVRLHVVDDANRAGPRTYPSRNPDRRDYVSP